jgi:transglutaminase-like putative cysteine protease
MTFESLTAEKLTLKLAELPFRSQLKTLEECLSAQLDPTLLLSASAQLRDHEPLAYLVRSLGQKQLLSHRGVEQALSKLFVNIPESGAHRVLRGLERLPLADEQLIIVVRAVVNAILVMKLPRLALLCLMDRWLKNIAPRERQELTDQALTECRRALLSGQCKKLTNAVLWRVPGSELPSLEELAREQRVHDSWMLRLKDFCHQVLDILGQIPKSLSQANAEDILARRVYTDPGHFLIELLQNAEDAAASTWQVKVGEQEINIWHDGIPFDAKDVVGLLSIGQTTKKKDQIGFFGVGFKSVYEVCERPQIYSEYFQFEVADVSIPRLLKQRPAGFPDHGTLIVLPLRNPEDPKRSPAKLTQKALEVPGQTLLTLPHLKSMQISGAGQSRSTHQEAGQKEGYVRLIHGEENSEENSEESFLVEEQTFTFYEPRESSKASYTPILIAIALDSENHPTALDPELPTIFSYLPTGERSGLRFLLHAHFDVPVDRERLDLSSAWNRWAIRHAGELLANLVIRLSADQRLELEVLESFLEVLPLNKELGHRAYESILEEFKARAESCAFLVGAGGQVLTPKMALTIEDPELRQLLAGSDLDKSGRRALKELCQRSREVVLALGVGQFGLDQLLTLIEDSVASSSCQQWLKSPALWTYLSRADCGDQLQRLGRLPVLPNQSGALCHPQRIFRGDSSLRELYRGIRPLLHEQLDHNGLQQLWTILDLPPLDPRRLLDDLEDPIVRAQLIESNGAPRLLAYLDRSISVAAGVGHLPLFPSRSGELHSLIASDEQRALWLIPAGCVGAFLQRHELGLPLIAQDIQDRFEDSLRHWGGRDLQILELLESCDPASNPWPSGAIKDFHKTLNQWRADLTSRMTQNISQTALFPDLNGTLRPLIGNDPALIAGDEDIRDFLSNSRWLDDDIAKLPYISQLGAEVVDALVVAEALLLDREELLDPFNDDDLRAAYRYLCLHPKPLLGHETLIPRLLDAPLWFDQHGQRHDLKELRGWPETEALRAFYESWKSFPLIEKEGRYCSSQLLKALKHDDQLERCDELRFVEDLVSDGMANFQHFDGQRSLLINALNEASRRLTAESLRALTQLPLFKNQAGEFQSLSGWDDEKWSGCRRVSDKLRPIFSLFSHSLLAGSEEQQLSGFLGALEVREARIVDLIIVLEDMDLSVLELGSLRRLLAEHHDELERIPESMNRESWRRRLSDLVIWPSAEGPLRAAKELILRRSIKGNNDRSVLEHWDFEGRLLAKDAEDQASVLCELMLFRDPVDFAYVQVKGHGRPGLTLKEQLPFLRSRQSALALLALLRSQFDTEQLLELPLSVDGAERLVTGRLFSATAAERLLIETLPLAQSVADEQWAAEALKIDERYVSDLPIRTALASLERAAPRASPGDDVDSYFARRERRLAFYEWLWLRRLEIGQDVHAKGSLSRCAAFLTSGDFLRPPKELLFEADAPDLGIDWKTADEVPEPLLAWLRQTYAPSEAHLDRLVSFLLDAHERAARERDGHRSAELLRYLSRALRVEQQSHEELERLVRKYKIHRRIRVQMSAHDKFRKPGQLLFPPNDGLPGLESFWKSAPDRVNERYQQSDTRALILALGARPELSIADVRRLLSSDQRIAGDEAQLAFARCLGRVIGSRAGVIAELRGLKWLPDRAGQLQHPKDLYWPSEELEAIIGARDDYYPHAEFVYTLSDAAKQKLPFLTLQEARLEDLVRQLSSLDEAAPERALEWLEEGLRQKRLLAADVREALLNVPFLQDSLGQRRLPSELVQSDDQGIFGCRRGVWPEARRYPRLLAALQIPALGRRSLLDYHRELEFDFKRLGQRLLVEQQELIETLPKYMAALADAKVSVGRSLMILAQNFDNEAQLLYSDHERLTFLSPESLALAVAEAKVELFTPVLLDDHAESCRAYLETIGVSDLTALWQSAPFSEELSGDVSENYDFQTTQLLTTIQQLTASLPLIEASLADIPGSLWAWTDQSSPQYICVVKQCKRYGSVLGTPIEWRIRGDYDIGRRRLILTEGELNSLTELPSILCRSWLTPGTEPPLLLLIIADFLLESWTSAALPDLLARHGITPVETVKKAPSERLSAVKDDSAPERADEEAGDGSTWTRFSRWFWGDDDKKEEAPETLAPAPPRWQANRPKEASPTLRPGSSRQQAQPPDHDKSEDPTQEWAPPTHKNWFRPRSDVQQQLRDHSRQRADAENPPGYGFAFAPAQLPVPYLYAPAVLAERFEMRGQRWKAQALEDEWRQGQREKGFIVSFHGRVPRGEVTIPLPLYGRLGDIDDSSDLRLIKRPGQLPLLIVGRDRDLRFQVIFDRSPNFQVSSQLGEIPDELLKKTVPDSELPERALAFIETLKARDWSYWKRSMAVRDFIRDSYRYDPTYLEDPAIARWLADVSRGRANVHLAALHSGRDARHMGRGVCYELNVLACELLRRAAVPAAIATGWTFDRGFVSAPDHLWAMALLPSDLGLRWWPVDASTTTEGRPLHGFRRPAPRWRARKAKQKKRMPKEPSWSTAASSENHSPTGARQAPTSELVRVLRHLNKEMGAPKVSEARLRNQCRALLSNPAKVKELWEWLKRLQAE